MNSENKQEENYWSERYKVGNIGWDIGTISEPLKSYFDQLKDKSIHILIPGAGNAYEAAYLHEAGFSNVSVLDISEIPLKNLAKRVTTFPKNNLIQHNFFEFEGAYDLIIEQTFFCSFEPTAENRSRYAEQMAKLLKKSGKLVGLWFKHPLTAESKRPFGGSKKEYLSYMNPYFDTVAFEDCYNSIPPRAGSELFGIFSNKITNER